MIQDPTVAWNPSVEELNAAMQPPVNAQEELKTRTVNDLSCINQRATVMINHFAPLFGVAASDLEHMLKYVEEGHEMSESELAAFADGVRRNIAKLEEAKDRLAQRANEIANIADILSKEQVNSGTN